MRVISLVSHSIVLVVKVCSNNFFTFINHFSMKHFAKFTYFIFVLITVFFVTFCAKPDLADNQSITDNTSVTLRTGLDDYAMTTNDITFANGMLCFKDTATLERTSKSLAALSDDPLYVTTYLNSIGALSNSDPQYDFPSFPIYRKFNERFGFVSLREYIDNTEAALMANGVDPDSLPHQFIGNTFLRSILNQYHEMKVGNLIYKMIDEHYYFVITNNDVSLLPQLRSSTNLFQIAKKNLIRLDDRIKDDSIRMDKIYLQSEGPLDCEYSFSIEKIGTNKYKFTNTTLYFNNNSGDANILWHITDAAGGLIHQTSTHMDVFDFDVPTGVIFPLSVTMIHTSPCSGNKTEIFATGNDCGFTVSANDIIALERRGENLTVNFTLQGNFSGTNYSVTWNFGDGTPNATVTNSQFVSHQFPENSGQYYYNVCATISINSNTCNETKTICKMFDFGCGIFPDDYVETTIFPIIPSGEFRLKKELYWDMRKAFPRYCYIGGKSTLLRKIGPVGFFKTQAVGLGINFNTVQGRAEWLKECFLEGVPPNLSDGNSGESSFDLLAKKEWKVKLKTRHNMFKADFSVILPGTTTVSTPPTMFIY